MMSKTKIKVIGAGLAGCEAAWQAAKLGVEVELYEMKPIKFSPAHHSEGFAELVCSNSLRSNDTSNAVGLLKEELRLMGSLILEAAYATAVPAGSALAVNRDDFSTYITEKIKSNTENTVAMTRNGVFCRRLSMLEYFGELIIYGENFLDFCRYK